MRILITTGIFKPELGGPATLAHELATRLHAAGHSVTVVTYSQKAHFDFDTDYTFKLVRIVRSNKFINYIKYFFAVTRLARQHDLIYSLDWFSAGMPVLAASIVSRKKYAVRVGGGYIWEKYLAEGNPPVTLKEFYEHGLYKKYKLMKFIIDRVLQHAEAVVFNSDDQRVLYEKFYHLNLARTLTIYNATPEHRFGTLLKSYKQDAVLAERDREIVFAGRFIRMKNIDSLIKAFAKLKDYSYKLVLIGEGPLEKELHALVESLKLSHRVVFLKPMPQKELYRRIANCAYVVIPSWTDVSPHQAYECLAQGIPFLLTKENYLNINKEKFLKIDPQSVDAIAGTMNWLVDPAHYADFARELSQLSFEHSWNEVVAEHLKLFTRIQKQS